MDLVLCRMPQSARATFELLPPAKPASTLHSVTFTYRGLRSGARGRGQAVRRPPHSAPHSAAVCIRGCPGAPGGGLGRRRGRHGKELSIGEKQRQQQAAAATTTTTTTTPPAASDHITRLESSCASPQLGNKPPQEIAVFPKCRTVVWVNARPRSPRPRWQGASALVRVREFKRASGSPRRACARATMPGSRDGLL